MNDPRPVARRGDPQTSWDAARSVEGIRESQARILALLLEFGPMDDESIAWYHRERWPGVLATSSGMRTRRAELASMGLVVDTGKKSRTKAGRATIVWRAREDSPRDLGGLLLDRREPETVPNAAPVYEELPDGF